MEQQVFLGKKGMVSPLLCIRGMYVWGLRGMLPMLALNGRCVTITVDGAAKRGLTWAQVGNRARPKKESPKAVRAAVHASLFLFFQEQSRGRRRSWSGMKMKEERKKCLMSLYVATYVALAPRQKLAMLLLLMR